jgi:hypothetical protein
MECRNSYGMPEFLWNVGISMECRNSYRIQEFLWNAGISMECLNFYGMPVFRRMRPYFPRVLEFLPCVQLSSASFAHCVGFSPLWVQFSFE